MRMPTKEEIKLERILDRAEEEGWFEYVVHKEGKYKGIPMYSVLKKDAPDWAKDALSRLFVIRKERSKGDSEDGIF